MNVDMESSDCILVINHNRVVDDETVRKLADVTPEGWELHGEFEGMVSGGGNEFNILTNTKNNRLEFFSHDSQLEKTIKQYDKVYTGQNPNFGNPDRRKKYTISIQSFSRYPVKPILGMSIKLESEIDKDRLMRFIQGLDVRRAEWTKLDDRWVTVKMYGDEFKLEDLDNIFSSFIDKVSRVERVNLFCEVER